MDKGPKGRGCSAVAIHRHIASHCDGCYAAHHASTVNSAAIRHCLLLYSIPIQSHKTDPFFLNLLFAPRLCFFLLSTEHCIYLLCPSVCSSGSALSCAVCSASRSANLPIHIGCRPPTSPKLQYHQSQVRRTTQNENAPTIRADISTHKVSSRAAWLGPWPLVVKVVVLCLVLT